MSTPRLAVAGDLTLTDAILSGIEREGAPSWFGRCASELLGDTLGLLCNLEAAVAGRGEPLPGKPILRSTASALEGLRVLRAVAVTQANNHVLDWGWAAARDTAAAVNRLGIPSTGLIGSGPWAAPIRLDLNGWTIGILAYAHSSSGAVFTVDEEPRVPDFDPDRAAGEVASLAKEVDAVLVSVHAGAQNVPYPEPQLLRAFRVTAMAGAALVFGHHAHCLRGLESPGGHWIAHGLGNFISPDHVVLQDGRRMFIPRLEDNRVGAVLIIEPAGRGRVALRDVRFVRTNTRGRPAVLQGRSASRWRRTMERLSEALERPDYERFQPLEADRLTQSRAWRFGLVRAIRSGPRWSQLSTAWRLLLGRRSSPAG